MFYFVLFSDAADKRARPLRPATTVHPSVRLLLRGEVIEGSVPDSARLLLRQSADDADTQTGALLRGTLARDLFALSLFT